MLTCKCNLIVWWKYICYKDDFSYWFILITTGLPLTLLFCTNVEKKAYDIDKKYKGYGCNKKNKWKKLRTLRNLPLKTSKQIYKTGFF